MDREVAAAIEKVHQKVSNLERNAEVPTGGDVYTKAEIDALIASIAPVGEVIWSGDDTPPTHTLECLHQAVSRTTYAALFAKVGTKFGAGDGSTTFNLPRAGVVPVGFDSGQAEFNSVGESGGEKTHLLTLAELAAHTHTQNAHSHGVSDPGHNHLQNSHNHTQNSHNHGQDPHSHSMLLGAGFQSGGTWQAVGTAGGGLGTSSTTATNQATTATNQATTATNQSSTTGVGVNAATAVNQNAGGGQAHNNLQPYEVLRKYIRY